MRIVVIFAVVACLCAPALADPIVNGSFESGFTGWTTVTTGTPFRPWAVSGAGQGGGFGMDQTSPQDGSRVAWNGFDGAGPLHFQLYQDVIVPTSGAFLNWMWKAQWNFGLGGFAGEARIFGVQIRNPGTNAVLATLLDFSTGTQVTNPTGNTGWMSDHADISAFSGQSVRVYFDAYIPQSFTGPGQLEIDAVSIAAVPEPGSFALIALGGIAALVYRRRKR